MLSSILKKSKVTAFLIFVIYWLWSRTWRFEVHEPPDLKLRFKNRESTLFAHWHGDEFVLLRLIGRYRIATMTSTSKDGELMNNVVGFVGGRTSRGSSTRGAVTGLKGLIRLIKEENRNCSIAVDGPKGPLHVVKPGIFELSRLLSAPIYSAGVSYSSALHFPRSWNKTFIPHPFAKVYVHWSSSMPALTKEQDPRDQNLASSLADELHAAKQQALKHIAVL